MHILRRNKDHKSTKENRQKLIQGILKRSVGDDAFLDQHRKDRMLATALRSFLFADYAMR